MPAVVECDDLKDYVCKYGKVYDLLNEYLAYSFAENWNIPTPPFCFVNVKENHVPRNVSKNYFVYTCFATEYLEQAKDINDYLLTWKDSPNLIKQISNKPDFLLIGLFDLWLCNEDRNHNNSNLLLNPVENSYIITAIDHVNIFNTNSLFEGFNNKNRLTELTDNESIINSNYTKMFFKQKDLTKELIEELIEKFYICVENCRQSFKSIVKNVPKDWNIEEDRYELIASQIFNADWTQQTEQTFRLILADTLKNELIE